MKNIAEQINFLNYPPHVINHLDNLPLIVFRIFITCNKFEEKFMQEINLPDFFYKCTHGTLKKYQLSHYTTIYHTVILFTY